MLSAMIWPLLAVAFFCCPGDHRPGHPQSIAPGFWKIASGDHSSGNKKILVDLHQQEFAEVAIKAHGDFIVPLERGDRLDLDEVVVKASVRTLCIVPV